MPRLVQDLRTEVDMKPSDAVYQWMTPLPLSVRRDDTLAEASRLFEKHGIRHLPVIDDEQLVGIVSERDVQVGEVFAGRRSIKVEVVMSLEPLIVHPTASLTDVAEKMLAKREDAVVVVEGGRVAGVFTSADALRAIAGSRPLP